MNETFLTCIVGAVLSAIFYFIGRVTRSNDYDNSRNSSGIKAKLAETANATELSSAELEQCIGGAERIENSISQLKNGIESAQGKVDDARTKLEGNEQELDRITKLFDELARRAESEDI